MALANVAALLADHGKKVLMVDWDLEAPGLERFFTGSSLKLSRSRNDTPGIVDLITCYGEKKPLDWKECLIHISLGPSPSAVGGTLQMITAGMLREENRRDYVQRLRELNWESLFGSGLGDLIDSWRSDWSRGFDFVLIDSRTGISDIGNICTILLPDVLVLVFTTNDQSVEGIADVMRRSRAAQGRLPLTRSRLSAVPLLSRDEREKENTLSSEWRRKIGDRLGEFYQDWLPPHTTPHDVLQKLYIPSIAFWSFGEKLPVVERREEIGDSRSIVAAYARVARFLENQLDWTKLEGQEEAFTEVVRRAEEERRRAEEERARAQLERAQAEQARLLLEEEETQRNRRQFLIGLTFRIFSLVFPLVIGSYLGFSRGRTAFVHSYGLGLLGSTAFSFFSILQGILLAYRDDLYGPRPSLAKLWNVSLFRMTTDLILILYAPSLPLTLLEPTGEVVATGVWVPFFLGAGSYAFVDNVMAGQLRTISKSKER
jgi:cellulose biosynthesis protein BcsQ